MYGLQHVVLDTNVVGADRHLEFFSGACEKLIQSYNERTPLTVSWIVPHIVRLERMNQMYLKFQESAKVLRSALRVLNFGADLDEAELRRALSEHIDSKFREYNLRDAVLDSTLVDWERVITDAAARESVFEPGNTEKGFKDRVFYETVKQIFDAGPYGDDNTLWVVTGDTLLAQELAKSTSQLKVVGSIDELRSEFNAKEAQISELKLRKLLMNAETAFYVAPNLGGLWIEQNGAKVVQTKFPNPFSAPPGYGPLVSLHEHIDPPIFLTEENGEAAFASRYSVTPYFMTRVGGDQTDGTMPVIPPGAILLSRPSLLQVIATDGLNVPNNDVPYYYVGVQNNTYSWQVEWSAKVGPHLELSNSRIDEILPLYDLPRVNPAHLAPPLPLFPDQSA